jgi:hypothetical protein
VITLQLIPQASPAAPRGTPEQPFQGTTLNVQPAPGSGAETAPPLSFPRSSKPTADFEAVRAGLRTIVETTVVDLSVAHTLAAGTAVVLQIQGTAFFIDKGADVGLATLHIQDQTNTPVNSINVFPGDAYDVPFTFVVIENTAQPGKVLRIHYGTDISFKPGLGGNVTFTGGVAILQTAAGAPQGADQTVSNGNAFAVSVAQGATPAQLSMIQCSNPAASGKRMYLDSIDLRQTDGAADTYFVGYLNAELGSAIGAQATTRKSDGSTGVSSTRGRTDATGAAPGPIITGVVTLAVNDFRTLTFNPPLKCDQGNGITVRRQTVNLICAATFHFREY